MKYFVEIGDHEFEVDFQRGTDGQLRAYVEGRPMVVDLEEIEPRRRYSVLVDQNSYDVLVDRRKERVNLHVGGRQVDALVEDERQHSARQLASQGALGPTTITSLMPGVIREVRVEVGQRVEPGETLVVLEAMKMENEIQAEHTGIVAEVPVSEGQAVEGGATLVTLTPPPDESAG